MPVPSKPRPILSLAQRDTKGATADADMVPQAPWGRRACECTQGPALSRERLGQILTPEQSHLPKPVRKGVFLHYSIVETYANKTKLLVSERFYRLPWQTSLSLTLLLSQQ